MKLNRLELDFFRNYAHVEATFHPRVNLIYGDNAQGKTKDVYKRQPSRRAKTSSVVPLASGLRPYVCKMLVDKYVEMTPPTPA